MKKAFRVESFFMLVRKVSEEVCNTDGELAVLCAVVLKFAGFEQVGHSPCVLGRYLPMLPEFHAATARKPEVASGIFEGRRDAGIAFYGIVCHHEREIGSAEHEWCYIVLKPIEACPFESQVEWLSLIHI